MNTCLKFFTKVRLFAFFLATITTTQLFAVTTTCTTSGAWTSSGTWDNGVPSSTTDVVVPSGKTVTMDGVGVSCKSIALTGTLNWTQSRATAVGTGGITMYNGASITGSVLATGTLTCSGNLSIPSSAVVTIAKVTLNISGNTTIYGGGAQVNFTNVNGTKTFSNITINSGGTWNCSVNESFDISGNLQCDGTFTSGAGDYFFTGTSATIGGTLSMDSLEINSGGSVTNNGTLTINSKLATSTGTGTLINGTGATLNINVPSTKDISITTFTASATNNTVNYANSSGVYQYIETPSSSTFYNLSISGSGNKYVMGDITVSGSLAISGSAVLRSESHQITGNGTGTFTMASGTELSLGLIGSSTNVLFPTNFTASNTTLNAASLVRYDTEGSQSISRTPTYGNLEINGWAATCTKTLSGSGSLVVSGDLTLSESTGNLTLDITTSTLNVSGNIAGDADLNASTGTIFIGGNYSNTGTLTVGSNIVNYNGTSDQVVKIANYYVLTIQKASGTATISNSGTLTATTLNNLSGTISLSNAATISNVDIQGTLQLTSTSSGINIDDFKIYSGGTATHSSAITVNVSGNFTNNGTFTVGGSSYNFTGTAKQFSGSSATSFSNIQVTGTYTNNMTVSLSVKDVTGSGSLTNASNKTLYISGVNTVTTFDATASGNSVEYNSTSSQIIRATSYYHLISSSTGSRTISSGTTVKIAGTFTTGSNGYTTTGSTVEFNGSSAQVIPQFNFYNLVSSSTGTRTFNSSTIIGIAGAFTIGSNSYTVTGSRVDFNGSGVQTIPAFTFYNLTVSNNNSVSLAGAVTVNGNFDNQGQFSAATYAISLAGNWNNDGVYTNTTNTLTLSGTSDQSITGSSSTTFTNLTINKSSGTLTLSAATTVNGTLTLTSGKIYTTSTNLLTLGSSASVTGASNSSYVDGPVAKVMTSTSAFTFPTGKNGRYQSVAVTPASAVSVTFRSEYFDATTNNSPCGTGIQHVSQVEYHQVDRTSGTTNAYVTLSWGTQSKVDGSALADLRVARWNGSQWEDKGQASVSGSSSSGTIKSNLVTSFSPFKLASATSSNPLPVNLVSFSAEIVKESIQLNWETASEIDNDYFSIEKSTDGISFEEIEKIAGNGNSNVPINYSFIDENPHNGISYYRLKQVDFNGAYEYSAIVSANFEKETDNGFVILNGNLSSSSLKMIVNGYSDQTCYFKIVYLSGKVCSIFNYAIHGNSEMLSINMEKELQSGIYLILMSSADEKVYSQKMLIQYY